MEMNEILRQLHQRKSVRAFADRPVEPEVKRAILEAAMAAPTAGNQQMYTILDITDPALRQRLAVTCDNQPFIAQAPMALIFCADFQKWYDAFAEGGCSPRRPGVGELVLAVTDAAIAAQNAVTAAQSLGVGSCYIGDILENCETHRELLGLPEYVIPSAMLVLGYPTPQQMERKKPERCRLEDIVCENVYRRKDGAALRAMFADRHPQLSYEEWASRFCARKYHSDFSREMTRSVGKYLQSWADPVSDWCDEDDDTPPVIAAEKQLCKEGEPVERLPETALVFFMGRGMKHLLETMPGEWQERPARRFLNGDKPAYVHRSGRLCMIHGGYGAPQAADTVETLRALGVKRMICAGMCGGYGADTALGDVILPNRAFAEEGASRHYYGRIDFATPSPRLLERAAAHFPEGRALPVVTTDAVFRQTFRKEALWREKGAVGVDMECSAVFSIGRKLGMETVMVMVVSDRHPLAPGGETDWQWHMPKESRERFAQRCFELALESSGVL